MPKVKVTKQSNHSPSEAFDRVSKLLNNSQDLKKLDPAYTCKFNSESLTGTATGKMFKANMTVSGSGDSSDVEIVVDLPLALALAKGMVEKTLQRKLDESLG